MALNSTYLFLHATLALATPECPECRMPSSVALRFPSLWLLPRHKSIAVAHFLFAPAAGYLFNLRRMRIVLAYSGGLDTSVLLSWIKEKYGAEMVAFCANIGQEEELQGLE